MNFLNNSKVCLGLSIFFFILSLLCLSLLFYSEPLAASGSFGRTGANGYMEGRRYATVTVTGDETGNGVAIITGADLNVIKNHYIQKFITTPGIGDATPIAYTGTMTDGYGQSLSIPTRSTTAKEAYDVPSNLGANWPVLGPITITFTGIGEGNTSGVMLIVH